jgi:hypothetical protein
MISSHLFEIKIEKKKKKKRGKLEKKVILEKK